MLVTLQLCNCKVGLYITRFAREILQVLQMEGVKMAVFLLEGMEKVAVGKEEGIGNREQGARSRE